ncbi:glycosyltransferase [Parvularcula oceani]|uniref:glycosyltransferase n=1 Tax=Parvularcula oceani TaxID=1247963 RepID=UPI0004E1D39B|nr:glycosyltransferase [Parvularcula oceani]
MRSRIHQLEKSYRAREQFVPDELVYDIVFVLNINSRGWILEKIARIIARESNLHCRVIFSERNNTLTNPLPPARAYFFAHYAIAFFAMLHEPDVFKARRFVWFTHPDRGKGVSFDELAAMADFCEAVFVPNSLYRQLLIQIGASPDKVELVLGGADPELFSPKARGEGKIGFVSAYYDRKRPEFMRDVVAANPDREFLLLAPHPDEVTNLGLLWSAWEGFDELAALPNFEYVEARYEDFPRYYDRIDVLISLSKVEGGPIPLIEGLMSNALILATDTGFARDLIRSRENGWILPSDPALEDVQAALDWALGAPASDVSSEPRRLLSWASFGQQIVQRMFPPLGDGVHIDCDSSGSGERYAQGGWLPSDPTGMKMSQGRATLDLPFSSVDTPMALRLRMWRCDGREGDLPVSCGGPAQDRSYVLQGKGPQVLRHVTFSAPAEAAATRVQLAVPSLYGPSPPVLKLGWVEQVPLSLLKPGDAIRFDAEAVWSNCLEHGWHGAERSGTWSRVPRARLVLPVEAQADGLKLTISGRVCDAGRKRRGPLGGKRNGTTLRVAAPAHDISRSFEFEDEAVRDLTFILPGPVARGGIELVFTAEAFTAPKSLDPSSADDRRLGFMIQSIAFALPTASDKGGAAAGDAGQNSVRTNRVGQGGSSQRKRAKEGT